MRSTIPGTVVCAALVAAALAGRARAQSEVAVAREPARDRASSHPMVQYFEKEQTRISDELADIASGLEEALKTDDITAATRLYAVERATMRSSRRSLWSTSYATRPSLRTGPNSSQKR